jgi:hypothetical protein
MSERSAWWLLLWLVPVIALCGMAMHVTGLDNTCTEAGGRLEWSFNNWTLAECVRNGVVIHP